MTSISNNPSLLTQDMDGEVVILEVESGRYFSMDPVGSRIWNLLAELGDTDRVVEQMSSEYAVDKATLRRDIDDLVGRLAQAGLLTVNVAGA